MRKFGLGAFLMAAIFSCTLSMVSCNSDSSTTSSYDNDNNCAILNVVLGGLSRTVNTTSYYTGNDTTYEASVSGSLYSMYIDQYKQEIYNPDSLPMGTHVNKVVISTISSDGIMGYRTTWNTDTIFSTTDSMDFTNPRTFICYAYSGLAKKEYTLHVNVHQVDPEKFLWNQVATVSGDIQNLTAQRAFCKNGTLFVFALSDGQPTLLTSSMTDGNTWEKTTLALTAFNPNNTQMLNNKFYTLSGGKTVCSEDGKTWNEAGSQSMTALIATSSTRLFGLNGNTIYSSADGAVWTADSIDSDEGALPNAGFSSTCLPMSFNSNFEYVLMSGTNNGNNMEWKKTIDNKGDHSEAWSHYNTDDMMNYPFPSYKNLQMLAYDDKVLALGLEGDTLSLFSLSNDAGRTWIPKTTSYIHPNGIEATNFSWTMDDKSYIWIFCGGSGQIWRGRLNRLSFEKNQTSFTE